MTLKKAFDGEQTYWYEDDPGVRRQNSYVPERTRAGIDPTADRLLIELRTAGRKMCGKCRDQLIAAIQRTAQPQKKGQHP